MRNKLASHIGRPLANSYMPLLLPVQTSRTAQQQNWHNTVQTPNHVTTMQLNKSSHISRLHNTTALFTGAKHHVQTSRTSPLTYRTLTIARSPHRCQYNTYWHTQTLTGRGSDRTHRRSVTGAVLLYSCATILYKTRYQPAIAVSSTEAEFVAASDTGKSIL